MRAHGPWTVLQTREIYRDPWIDVTVDDVVRPDGKPGTHSVIRIKSGVCVLALDDERHVYFTHEFHYAVGRETLEGVSGGNDPPESFLDTAKRELREELGIVAGRWADLGVVDPFTANVVSPTHLYLAQDLDFVGAQRDGTETMGCVRVPLAEALAMVDDGRVTHAPTCVALLKIARLLG